MCLNPLGVESNEGRGTLDLQHLHDLLLSSQYKGFEKKSLREILSFSSGLHKEAVGRRCMLSLCSTMGYENARVFFQHGQ